MVVRSWLRTCLATLSISSLTHAYTAVPSPDLDLQSLGQVALGGDFDAITTYSYVGQKEGVSGNGTQSLIQRLPNGMFDVVAATDANIEGLCAFTTSNGTFLGIIIAGNFTSVGGIGAQSVAFIDAQTGTISPHPGIQGTVNAVLCDSQTNTAYLGGAFDAADSTNAIAWLSSGSWANLPFAGFDAPVTAITKAPNGHIVFGGSFTGLKNMTGQRDRVGEPLNLASATVTSVANITSGNNVLCPVNGSTSPSWQLQDRTAGSWTASMRYGYEPSRLRLWNNPEGRGVRTWRFTALPNTGIMNMTYIDPATGKQAYCDARCPLAQNTSLPYQDFEFVNRIGMNSFRIDVSDWYGQGAALKGIEIFQNDTFVYAIEAQDTPNCYTTSNSIATASATGPWTVTPSHDSYADYLTAVVGPTTVDTTEIVFRPNIQEKGNYTIVVYTPGCMQDSSCAARGVVSVTGNLTTTGANPVSTIISQTNDFEKYDQIYQGPIDPISGSFQPAITIRASKQKTDQLIVASRVRFSGNPSTGGLNGLFDYDPNVAVVDTDFSKSAINNVGTMLKPNAQISTFAIHEDTVYSAGSFSDDTFRNIMLFADNQARSLPGGGLNAAVATMYASNDYLYVGGNFTGTTTDSPAGLNNVAAYSFSDDAWVAMGAGVNGQVTDVVPFELNMTSGSVESVIGLTGEFSSIQASGSNPAHPVGGFAVWVPSRTDWLQNLGPDRQLLAGELCTYTTIPTNNSWLGAGTLVSYGQAISGTAGLRHSSNDVNIQRLAIDIQPSAQTSSNSMAKRAILTQQNVTGVLAGTYDTRDNRNTTILGGHFTAQTNTTTVQNLAFIHGSNGSVTGLPTGIDDNSTFLSLSLQNDILFAGGAISGNVNDVQIRGLVLYDLTQQQYRSPQPAALNGDGVIVNAIAATSGSSRVYVGGSFDSTAQGLACSSVCVYDTSSNTWSTAGSGLDGTVTALHFMGTDRLLAAGNLTLGGNRTSLAAYDTRQQTWTVYETAALPGPVTSFAETDADEVFWVSGTVANNGSAYLVQVNGANLNPVQVDSLFESGTIIAGLQMMQLTHNHGGSRFLDNDNDLLVLGQLNITGFGRASAALFNGTTMQPFLLSVDSAGNPGSLSAFFSSNANPAVSGSRFGHSRGIAILVAFCAALGTIFLIIVGGMILNRIQRARAGYSTLPSVPYQDKNVNLNRVPPKDLFASMGQRTPGDAPAV